MEAKITFNRKKLFGPLFWHLLPLLRDENIRYIFVEGGSSASKTHTIAQAIITDMLERQYSTMVFRRQQVDIKDSVLATFEEVIAQMKVHHFFKPQENKIRCMFGEEGKKKNQIRFRGLDKEENIKGIAGYDVVYNNEWSQFLERHFGQQRKRLRGRENQKFICDWNPVSSKLWLYENWIDKQKWYDLPLYEEGIPYSSLNPEFAFKRVNKEGNAVWIKITYRDNYWIVGHPSGKGGFVDKHVLADYEYDRVHHPNLYRVYANGERGIIRTGGEFWKQFNEITHVKPLKYDPTLPVHVSIDENVRPYVTISIWQIVDKEIRQIAEIPCKTPHNNAPKAAALLVDWLKARNYEHAVFLYGDPSTRKKSTIDENNRSFYDKFEAVIMEEFQVINRVGRSAPQISVSAAFVNAIYEGQFEWNIVICDECKVSIDDYITVKEDENGAMVKNKVKDENDETSVELYGHYSDAKRYFITTVLKEEFKRFKSGKRRTGSIAGSTSLS